MTNCAALDLSCSDTAASNVTLGQFRSDHNNHGINYSFHVNTACNSYTNPCGRIDMLISFTLNFMTFMFSSYTLGSGAISPSFSSIWVQLSFIKVGSNEVNVKMSVFMPVCHIKALGLNEGKVCMFEVPSILLRNVIC